ncbi:MAG TPA: DUF885 domain-containing protein [Jiangellaceae bacterium]
MTSDGAPPAPAASPLRSIADEYWEARMETSPLLASFFGDHRFDDRADDVSAEADQAVRVRWADLRERARALNDDALDDTDRVSRALLVGELDDAIRAIDLRLIELSSDQMQGVHADLLIEGYLASSIESDPFVNVAGPDEWDGEPGWRAELADAVRSTLRPAFRRHADVFARELEPAARPDDRAGLVHLPDGEEIYQALIQANIGLPLSADELHEIGLAEATGSLRAEFAEVGERAFGTADVSVIFDRLRNDPGLRYRDADELLAHASRCLDKATAAMTGWFGLLPQAACVLTPVPDYLAADVPPAYYTPPVPDGSRPGEYHVNLHEPTERGRYSTASIAYHEAIPGHHLQLAIASERTDLPAFRRLGWGQTAYVEGWALYTERLADEMGLYDDDLDRLGMLASDAWRACRLVVDTGLHARGWTRQRAVDFMVEHMPVDLDTITVEVDRYIGMPGQALAYKVGQREILALRAQAREVLGERFDIAGFHDAVLGAATVSLPVLRTRVEDWISAH